MYKEHPDFDPVSDDAIIWRYINFRKFESMINENALHFASTESFSDEFEGKYTSNLFGDVKASTEIQKFQEATYKKSAERTAKELRVNCWNISNDERVDFWERFVPEKGVAIQSTFGKLKDSFSQTETPIYIGKMKYIDYSKESINSLNLFSLILHKRHLYFAENELRAVIWIDYPTKIVPIETKLDVLIEKIVLHPNSPKDIQNTVEKMTEKLGHKFTIEYSKLSEKPI